MEKEIDPRIAVYTRFMSDGQYHWLKLTVSRAETCLTYTYKFVVATVLSVLKVAPFC